MNAADVFLGSLLTVGGVACTIYQFSLVWRAARASRWPTVSGQVISSHVEEGPASSRMIRVPTYRAIVGYAYEVGGKRWIAHRVFFGDDLSKSGNSALDMVNKYQLDTLVRVSYDPHNPSNAVLETGIRGEHVVWSALGLLIGCGGVAIAAGYLRRWGFP